MKQFCMNKENVFYVTRLLNTSLYSNYATSLMCIEMDKIPTLTSFQLFKITKNTFNFLILSEMDGDHDGNEEIKCVNQL
ncbi:CLUMA_CG021561, isoform A [Clunio marinus]|uniref:CLUMA_CG021561, isoform A n=1 Tax=Clunio marinus TaxID=568069 RepID=A0A1J1J9D9_9DIPT|nr:CLUMA_CG021561, isoform A [Clunio marinus]